MIINFIGNFQNGYVGEVGDASHLTRELQSSGNIVRRIPQDEWREHILDGKSYPNVPSDLDADINIICKWHHFFDGRFIEELRKRSKAPVFYWVWDYMWDQGLPDWHLKAIEAADLYLGNDVRSEHYKQYNFKNLYYFPFDVADMDLPLGLNEPKKYDISFFGSWIGQGHRQVWLTEINKTNPITVFSWNHKDWPEEFNAQPAVYGASFNQAVAQSKIVLGFSVEPHCWGYWSNRVGKVLLAGGFLLYEYTPGMELFLRDGVEYFSTIEEARGKIEYYLLSEEKREEIAHAGQHMAFWFSSTERVKDLVILIQRYLKKGDAVWQT